MAENIVSAVNELIAAVEGAGLEQSHATSEQLRLQLQAREAALSRLVPEKEILEKQKASLQCEVIERCKELGEKGAELSAVVSERDGLAKELEEKDAELSAVVSERDGLAKELEEKGAELSAVVSECDGLAKELKEKGAELSAVVSKHDELAADLEAHKSEADMFFSDRESWLQEKQELERQIDTLLEQLQNVQGDLELYVLINRQQDEMLEESLDFQKRTILSQFNVLSAQHQKLLSPAGS